MGDKVHRSPQYPMIDLERAIAYAQTLYEKERLLPVAVVSAAKNFGYAAGSSAGIRTVAALLHYGLLDEEGAAADRRVRLSDLAKAIILDKRPDSAERVTAIREAALRPAINQEAFQAWGAHLPSPQSLEYELVRKFDFHPEKARAFSLQLHRTFDFAKLGEADTIATDMPEPEGTALVHRNRMAHPQTPHPAQMQGRATRTGPIPGQGAQPPTQHEWPSLEYLTARIPVPSEMQGPPTVELPIPLSGGLRAVLAMPATLTEGDHALLVAVLPGMLNAMKNALVQPANPSAHAPDKLGEYLQKQALEKLLADGESGSQVTA